MAAVVVGHSVRHYVFSTFGSKEISMYYTIVVRVAVTLVQAAQVNSFHISCGIGYYALD